MVSTLLDLQKEEHELQKIIFRNGKSSGETFLTELGRGKIHPQERFGESLETVDKICMSHIISIDETAW